MLVPPVMVNRQITVHFSRVVMKVLSLDRRKRYQTAEEFRESLEKGIGRGTAW